VDIRTGAFQRVCGQNEYRLHPCELTDTAGAIAAISKGAQCREDSFMIIRALLIASMGSVVSVADTVPRYDVRPTCRAAVALTAGSEGRTVESRMAGEERSRKDLEKDWAKIPTAERTQCMGTVNVGGSLSLVELQICLEMMQDLRKHLEDERAKT
jgi:hypothetical protein